MTGKKKGRTPRSSASASASPSFASATLPQSAALLAAPPINFGQMKPASSDQAQVLPLEESADPSTGAIVPKVEDGVAKASTATDAVHDVTMMDEPELVPEPSADDEKVPPLADERPPRETASMDADLEQDQEASSAAPEKRPARARGANGKNLADGPDEYEDEELQELPAEEIEDDGITRCVCGDDNEELSSGLMIECDTCKCWQHGPCVGLFLESECPDRYFCEQCKPSWHGVGGVLRKTFRKSSAAREASAPPVPRNNKPRESADSAMIQAYLESRLDTGDQAHPQSGSRSPSPVPARAKAKEPVKKRNTMNSRDAAYDRAIALSLMEANKAVATTGAKSKQKMGDDLADSDGEDRDENGLPEARHPKRRKFTHEQPVKEDGVGQEADTEAGESDRREDEAIVEGHENAEASAPPVPTGPVRGKHPNQYTYRPKTAGPGAKARASPVKRSKDAGNGESGGGGNGGRAVGGGGSGRRDGASEGGWGMPDHLKYLAHLLPTPQPRPLVIPGPAQSSMSSNGQDVMAYSTPTRVKFPHKRMTLPEMKKRVRHVLDHLSRVRVEMSERDERNEVLNQSAQAVLAAQKQEAEREAATAAAKEAARVAGHERMDGVEAGDAAEETDVEIGLSAGRTTRKGAGQLASVVAQAESQAVAVQQIQDKEKAETFAMMDALVRDVQAFQEKYFGQAANVVTAAAE
ncbi:Histone deacetylase complex subunit [Microbotryomycetes sp. JL201]|nr:Histone deacetylase complex subunit [Microbotryomycetes sp. JL201]